MHARGFLTRLLSEGQRKEVRDWENRLPPGRYLTASEICKFYVLKPDPISDMSMAYMQRFHTDWLRTQKQTEETMQKRIHAFENYVLEHFAEPVPPASAGWMNA